MIIRTFDFETDSEDISNADCREESDAALVDAICTPMKRYNHWLSCQMDNRCVGVTAYTNELAVLHVDLLYITPEYRNKTLGTQVLDTLKGLAKLRKKDFITIEPFTSEAETYFLKYGFKKGIWDDRLHIKLTHARH